MKISLHSFYMISILTTWTHSLVAMLPSYTCSIVIHTTFRPSKRIFISSIVLQRLLHYYPFHRDCSRIPQSLSSVLMIPSFLSCMFFLINFLEKPAFCTCLYTLLLFIIVNWDLSTVLPQAWLFDSSMTSIDSFMMSVDCSIPEIHSYIFCFVILTVHSLPRSPITRHFSLLLSKFGGYLYVQLVTMCCASVACKYLYN